MKLCKVFAVSDPKKLEAEVNEFLSLLDVSIIGIISSNLCVVRTDLLIYTILYEDGIQES